MQSESDATASAQALAQAYTQGVLPCSSAAHALSQHTPQPVGLQSSDVLAVSPSCACGRPHLYMLSLR